MNDQPSISKNSALPAGLVGHVVAEHDGWLKLEGSFILELIKDKRMAGTVPPELRWKWSDSVRISRNRQALIDNCEKLWDWKVATGLWIKPM